MQTRDCLKDEDNEQYILHSVCAKAAKHHL